jgi:hypothetical protein
MQSEGLPMPEAGKGTIYLKILDLKKNKAMKITYKHGSKALYTNKKIT